MAYSLLGMVRKKTMNCWHCNTEILWGGDHDIEDDEVFSMVTNLSCLKCGCHVEVYYPKENDVKEKSDIIKEVEGLAKSDTSALHEAEQSYGNSWKKRGGVGAYMMLARKWDRLEQQVQGIHWDVFKAIATDTREEGVLDDIGDLRRYLFLVEAEMRMRLKGDKQKPK